MNDELKTILEAMQQEARATREELHAMREEINDRFARGERENAAAHRETRHHMGFLLESFVQPKIEMIVETITLLDERVTRETADIRQEMRKGFADTHDLIRFGYSQLDRRITALEHP